EIQGSRRPKLKRIRSRNMLQVQLGTAVDKFIHHPIVPVVQAGGICRYPFEKVTILDQRNLNGFSDPPKPLPVGQRRQKCPVIEYGNRRAEGADEVFFTTVIDTILYPHSRIVLRKNGCRHADMPDTPMSDGGCIADCVQYCSAAYGHDIGMPVNSVPVHRIYDTVNDSRRVLRDLPSRYLHDFVDQHHTGQRMEIVLYPSYQTGMMVDYPSINSDEQFWSGLGHLTCKECSQKPITRPEQMLRKTYIIMIINSKRLPYFSFHLLFSMAK